MSDAPLVRYDAARKALAEARSVDEVKDIRDKAAALSAYARQAKDTEMIEWATEIKVRAERRLGEILRETPKATGGQPYQKSTGAEQEPVETPTLAELGIDKKLSARVQKLAEMPEDQFETAVATAKETVGQVTTAFLLRHTQPARKTRQQSRLKRAAGGLSAAAKRRLEELNAAIAKRREEPLTPLDTALRMVSRELTARMDSRGEVSDLTLELSRAVLDQLQQFLGGITEQEDHHELEMAD